MQVDQVKGILIAGELLSLVAAAGCVLFMFFNTLVLSVGFLGLTCMLFAIYLATVRNGLGRA